MKLLVATFIVVILLLSMTPLSTSSFSASSSRHAVFSPDKSPVAFTIRNRTLTSPNVQSYGGFGYSVSMSSKLVVVGAPYETANGYEYAGHAYVFNAKSGALITTLTSPNAQSGLFGYSVSISGKLVVVGAVDETADGYSDAGHAYVFNAMSGALIANLTSPNAQTFGYFGISVSISGKLVTVGAPYETADGYDQAGHAYVFNAMNGALVTTLSSPNAQSEGYFGWSVSISGKLVAVGAWDEIADGYAEAGHAYVFNAKSGALITTLTSPNVQLYGYFGASVSLSGKLVAVGAWDETDDGYSFAGNAYVFKAMTGALIANLTSPNAQTYGAFGFSVSVNGKLVAVGAPYETADGYSYAGHAYVFSALTGKLIQTLASPNAQSEGEFGYSVSIIGKLITVGAPTETAGGQQNGGHAYVFYNV